MKDEKITPAQALAMRDHVGEPRARNTNASGYVHRMMSANGPIIRRRKASP